MEWQLSVLIRVLIAAAVIVINLAILVGCYCCARNKRCPVYKRRQEARARMDELKRPENTKYLNYPRQQRVLPNTEYQYDSQFDNGNVGLGEPSSIPGSM